jgi:hypothetical protein
VGAAADKSNRDYGNRCSIPVQAVVLVVVEVDLFVVGKDNKEDYGTSNDLTIDL